MTAPSGEQIEVTIDSLMRVQHVSERQARRRITEYRAGRLTVKGLLKRMRLPDREIRKRLKALDAPPPERKPKEFKKYGGISVPELVRIAPFIEKRSARKRLVDWESGQIDCDRLFMPPGHLFSWGDLGLGPRREPEDIKITRFERELGAEIEKNWNGKISQEWL